MTSTEDIIAAVAAEPVSIESTRIDGREELESTIAELKKKNRELKTRCENYEKQIQDMRESNERAFLRGRISGLEFSIRCNGVSGGEV